MFYIGIKSKYIGFFANYAKNEYLRDLFVGKFFEKFYRTVFCIKISRPKFKLKGST